MNYFPLMFRWWDFAAGEFVTLAGPPDTDEQAVRLIPQSTPAQGLYRCYRQRGDSVIDALLAVLEAVIRVKESVPAPVPQAEMRSEQP